MRPPTPATETLCRLCQLPADGDYCCAGCRNVHAILIESGVAQPGADLRETELFRRSLQLGLVSNAAKPGRVLKVANAVAQEKLFQVSGMWCVSCAWLIEHILTRDPGIASAEVLFASDLLKVRYYPQYMPPGRIEERVRALGYRLSEFDGESTTEDRDRRTLLTRLGVAAFLWVNVMTLNLSVFLGYFEHLEGSIRRILPFVVMSLAAPVILYSAQPILALAWQGLRHRVLRMESLLALGIVSAYGYSAVEAVRGGTHIYFDIACAIVTLVLLGKFLEQSAKESATRSIRMLHRVLPSKARLIVDGHERFVSIEALRTGDVFIVKAGERIPADGVIVQGESHVDESILTGESTPVAKGPDGVALGGSLNLGGVLEVRATTIGAGSTLARIIHAVEHALSTRAPIERMVDRVSRTFVPAVILIAVVVGIFAFTQGSAPGAAIMRAITVLVIACPCALGIATPLALSAAVSAASRSGILIRDTAVLETVRGIDTVVLDKTGTVTDGEFALLEYQIEHLPLLAALEQYSEHPLGRAVVRAAELTRLPLPHASAIEIRKGEGIRGCVDGCPVFIGSRSFAGADAPAEDDSENRTVVYYGWDGTTQGRMVFGDRVRPEAAASIGALRESGIRVIIASGDSAGATAPIARAVGANEYRAGLLPHEKQELLAELARNGACAAMVGDGINDAPALASAKLGMAMGCGTEVAMTAASIVLMTNDLRRVHQVFTIARGTIRVIQLNLFWAFFYNVAGITMAAAGMLNPVVAAGAMVASSLFVVANSHRLNRRLSQPAS